MGQIRGCSSIGATGSEGGVVLRDDEHLNGARITLERAATRFAITCGVYGWMVHTRFFSTEGEAVAAYEEMKPGLVEILARLPADDDMTDAMIAAVSTVIQAFVERFP